MFFGNIMGRFNVFLMPFIYNPFNINKSGVFYA